MLIQQRGHVVSRMPSAASPVQSPEKAAQDSHHYQQPHTATSFTCISSNGGPVFFVIQTKKALTPKERSNFITAMIFNDLGKHSFGYAFPAVSPPTILIGQTGKKYKHLSDEDLKVIGNKLRAIAAGVGIDIAPVQMEALSKLPEDWQQTALQSTVVQHARDSLPRKVRR